MAFVNSLLLKHLSAIRFRSKKLEIRTISVSTHDHTLLAGVTPILSVADFILSVAEFNRVITTCVASMMSEQQI